MKEELEKLVEELDAVRIAVIELQANKVPDECSIGEIHLRSNDMGADLLAEISLNLLKNKEVSKYLSWLDQKKKVNGMVD